MSTRSCLSLGAALLIFLSAGLLSGQSNASNTAAPQAPAATPDFSGVWTRRGSADTRYMLYGFSADELPMTSWALDKYKANKPSFGPHMVTDTNDPTYDCYLPGIPRIYVHPAAFEFIHAPGRVIQYFEYDGFVRQIWTDGRPHLKIEDSGELLWMGDSIGHWEGDTLVVDTTNFNDKTWLDRAGHPHSEELHLSERIRRVDKNSLQIDMTIEDPKAYTKPIKALMNYQLRPDWHILEHACTDFPRPTP